MKLPDIFGRRRIAELEAQVKRWEDREVSQATDCYHHSKADVEKERQRILAIWTELSDNSDQWKKALEAVQDGFSASTFFTKLSPYTQRDMLYCYFKLAMDGHPDSPHVYEEAAVTQLIAAGVLFVSGQSYKISGGSSSKETMGLVALCNDLFYWASADREEVTVEDLPGLYLAWLTNTVEPWICLKRGMRPQTPIEEEWRANGKWTDALEALPPRDPKDCG